MSNTTVSLTLPVTPTTPTIAPRSVPAGGRVSPLPGATTPAALHPAALTTPQMSSRYAPYLGFLTTQSALPGLGVASAVVAAEAHSLIARKNARLAHLGLGQVASADTPAAGREREKGFVDTDTATATATNTNAKGNKTADTDSANTNKDQTTKTGSNKSTSATSTTGTTHTLPASFPLIPDADLLPDPAQPTCTVCRLSRVLPAVVDEYEDYAGVCPRRRPRGDPASYAQYAAAIAACVTASEEWRVFEAGILRVIAERQRAAREERGEGQQGGNVEGQVVGQVVGQEGKGEGEKTVGEGKEDDKERGRTAEANSKEIADGADEADANKDKDEKGE